MREDSVITAFANYADDLTYDDLDEETITQAKLVILDSLACTIPAREEPEIQALIEVCSQKRDARNAQIIGYDDIVSPEYAAFVTASLIRYLDWSDTYISRGSSHPSGNIGTLLSLSDAYDTSGQELVLATVLAYEIQCRLVDLVRIKKYSFDHTTYGLIASTIAGGKLRGLSDSQICEAGKIALAGNMQLRQGREGNLTEWKNLAIGNASRNATVAIQLAANGLHGPEFAFDGDFGFVSLTEPFEVEDDDLGGTGNDFRINQVFFKLHPVCYHIHAVIDCVLELLDQENFAVDDIDTIRCETYSMAIQVTGTSEKYDPKTRASADHSLPYCVARTLLDGEMKLAQYAEEKIHDPTAKKLMEKIEIIEDPTYTEKYGSAFPIRVSIHFDGTSVETSREYPEGHYRNPASFEQITDKFREAANPHYSHETTDEIIEWIDNIENYSSLSELFELFAIPS